VNVPRVDLRPDYSCPRIIKGSWQIADDHSASVRDDEEMYRHMAAFVDAGITAFDCGDIYYGVEERIGRFIERFRRERGAEAARRIQVHTKYIPAFLQREELASQTRAKVEAVIDRSLRRLRQERLDLVQLHWWEYAIPGNVETALILKELQQAGKIHHIAGTNYNVAELRRMIDAGVDVVANQVQFSVTDRRPQNGMIEYCRAHDVHLLCYGAIGGGLFSRKWLGIPDPGKPAFENVSLDKYYRIIVDFGGWALFQEVLAVMDRIAHRHRVSIATVASRYVLEQPTVAAVIQGARHARHLQENLTVFSFELDAEDQRALDAVLARSSGPRGDCYDLDREENRDALENVATEYFDVENGALVVRHRAPITVAEPYGHHLKS